MSAARLSLASTTTQLAITNPLVLYRSLLATQRIEPDPAQHRLAIHLARLYTRLKDYEPTVEYRQQLRQVSAALRTQPAQSPRFGSFAPSTQSNELRDPGNEQSLESPSRWNPLRAWRKTGSSPTKSDSLALTRRLTDHEAARTIDSPQGLLLHGDVGTGKSMLVDLLADALPTRKKRRAHFHAFMLETLAALEDLRLQKHSTKSSVTNGKAHAEVWDGDAVAGEHALLTMARDLIERSPILFLDEFQLPDRAAAKILSGLFTSFFQLGGVLIATSNRMPDELNQASGIAYPPPPPSNATTRGALASSWSRLRQGIMGTAQWNAALPRHESDFAAFLDVLKARCEIWHMEGVKDWRRVEAGSSDTGQQSSLPASGQEDAAQPGATTNMAETTNDRPSHYLISTSDDTPEIRDRLIIAALQSDGDHGYANVSTVSSIPWQSMSMQVYGRTLVIPCALHGVCYWSFPELCETHLGPADYISLAARFHTMIIDNVPILTSSRKNEARRFITLLDALYEARCKLLITAEALPDHLFFPQRVTHQRGDSDPSSATFPLPQSYTPSSAGNLDIQDDARVDEVYAETLSEVYQDQISPFRPNIVGYASSASPPEYETGPLSSAQASRNFPSPALRSILADEDSDFGPIATSHERMAAYPAQGQEPPAAKEGIGLQTVSSPNFRDTAAFTGEDERFAYKRAQSRLWEMCGDRWWSRQDAGWWRPMPAELRRWERPRLPDDPHQAAPDSQGDETGALSGAKVERLGRSQSDSPDLPPKISWVHAWGMMQWGRKAGRWGRGVEAKERRPVNDSKPES